jgi:hypothetical protein
MVDLNLGVNEFAFVGHGTRISSLKRPARYVPVRKAASLTITV